VEPDVSATPTNSNATKYVSATPDAAALELPLVLRHYYLHNSNKVHEKLYVLLILIKRLVHFPVSFLTIYTRFISVLIMTIFSLLIS
jgi:hypothetical protein